MGKSAYRNQEFSADPGIVVVRGGFSTNGGSSPVTFLGPYGLTATGPYGQSNLPNGITALTRTGAGQYTLTFLDNFFTYLVAEVFLSLGAAANSFAQFNGFTNLNSATLGLTAIITTLTAGAAADIAAATGNIVSFEFSFKQSQVV